MLRIRSEKRRLRHVEALQRQKQEEKEEEDGKEPLGGERSTEESDMVFDPISEPQSPAAAASMSPDSGITGTTQTQVSEDIVCV